jgi:hypothetical protein
MYQFGNLLEELEVLENQRRIAEDAYFANEDDLEIEEAFGEAVNAESAAFHRLCNAIVEFTDGRIQSHTALRILMRKREALKEIVECL